MITKALWLKAQTKTVTVNVRTQYSKLHKSHAARRHKFTQMYCICERKTTSQWNLAADIALILLSSQFKQLFITLRALWQNYASLWTLDWISSVVFDSWLQQLESKQKSLLHATRWTRRGVWTEPSQQSQQPEPAQNSPVQLCNPPFQVSKVT